MIKKNNPIFWIDGKKIMRPKWTVEADNFAGIYMEKYIESKYPNYQQCTFLYDLSNFSFFKQFYKKQVNAGMKSCEKYSPEKLGNLLVYKPPTGMGVIMSLMKMIVPERSTNKIKLIYKKKDLQKYIDIDVLEEKYGGTHEPYPYLTSHGEVYDLNQFET